MQSTPRKEAVRQKRYNCDFFYNFIELTHWIELPVHFQTLLWYFPKSNNIIMHRTCRKSALSPHI